MQKARGIVTTVEKSKFKSVVKYVLLSIGVFVFSVITAIATRALLLNDTGLFGFSENQSEKASRKHIKNFIFNENSPYYIKNIKLAISGDEIAGLAVALK